MKEDVKNRLHQYSLFTCVNILLQRPAAAEVIYTDINPDTVLDAAAEFYSLDIDNNGTFDFAFLNTSGTTYDFTLGSLTLQSLLAGPMVLSDAIAGISHYYFYDGGYRFLPSALSSESLIGSDLTWQEVGIQYLAWSTYTGVYDNHCNHCDWANDTLIETKDKYLGLRFLGDDNNQHYGWVRCDVLDFGQTLVIKDYAYETESNYPILAGSKETYQNINSNILSGNIYASGNIVYVNISSRPELDFTLNIYDISGRCVYQKNLHESRNSILTSLTTGIYLVEVQCGMASFAKTLLLDK